MAFLMTDGTVIAQGGDVTDFYKLTPDAFGSYVNGTWSQIASLPAGYAPQGYASAILADGRLVLVGGEGNVVGGFQPYTPDSVTNMSAIYDPVSNAWTMIPAPAGVPYIGDSPSTILPDGRLLIGDKFNTQLRALDPATLQWTALNSRDKSDYFAEEGFTLLPSGSVLTIDVQHAGHAEHYVPSEQQWISDGSTPTALVSLQVLPVSNPSGFGPAPRQVVGGVTYGPGPVGIYSPPGEIGPAVLRPDGSVFATGGSDGGSAHTAIYRPGVTPMEAGTWTAGPDFPDWHQAADSSAALLPSGNVLVLSENSKDHFAKLFEFDGTQFLTAPIGPGTKGFLLPLPEGE